MANGNVGLDRFSEDTLKMVGAFNFFQVIIATPLPLPG